jgi:DMSO/TMAO reductase YedYZ molybdopterin-dependent catalytic subunit
MALPPGQHAIDGFPRFGTHMQRPAPAVPADPKIEIGGAVTEPFSLSLSDLAALPRRELTTDFHCVSGWSATNLRWEGVPFERFFREVIEPALRPGASVTHVLFRGLDRYRSVVQLEDALADDVLIAENLDGRPLDSDHGAPLRLVSPSQYGFISVKHLCRIEALTEEPPTRHGAPGPIEAGLRLIIKPHPRARVWEEERHKSIPGPLLRGFYYRVLRPPIAILCARGSRKEVQE